MHPAHERDQGPTGGRGGPVAGRERYQIAELRDLHIQFGHVLLNIERAPAQPRLSMVQQPLNIINPLLHHVFGPCWQPLDDSSVLHDKVPELCIVAPQLHLVVQEHYGGFRQSDAQALQPPCLLCKLKDLHSHNRVMVRNHATQHTQCIAPQHHAIPPQRNTIAHMGTFKQGSGGGGGGGVWWCVVVVLVLPAHWYATLRLNWCSKSYLT